LTNSIFEETEIEILDMPVLSTENETASCVGVDPPSVAGTCDCEQDLYLASLNEIDCGPLNIMYWYHPDYPSAPLSASLGSVELEIIYFYHPDYLGSTEFITDMRGEPYQFFLNTPWGENLENQYAKSYTSFSSRFRFNSKEWDEETGNFYYGGQVLRPED